MTLDIKRFRLPLVLIGFLVVAQVAYFAGRRSVAPVPGAAPAGEKHGGEANEEPGRLRLAPEAEKTAGVRVQPARRAPLTQTLTVPGTVEVSPGRTAKITPPVAGRVVKILVNRGDAVRAGQSLAILDSTEVAESHAREREAASGMQRALAEVQTAQAGVGQALTRLGSGQAALRRQRALAQTGTFTQPSLQAAQRERSDAEAELAQARSARQAQTTALRRAERLVRDELISRAELEQAQAAVAQEEARVEQAEARVHIAGQALEREQKVFRGGLLSKQPIQAAEADVRAAEGEVRQARKQEQATRTALRGAQMGLASARATLRALEGNGHTEGGTGRLVLHSPLQGVVVERDVTLGQAVEQGSELFDIQDLRIVLVSASVPEREVARVRAGQPVEITVAAYPGVRFGGRVQSIASAVDPKTRALPVRVRVDNAAGRLRPQMFAQVVLPVGRRTEALVVPAAAVAEEGRERFVFVREEGGYERRPVQVGRAFGDAVEITGGLQGGEPVVTAGVFVLKSELAKAELKGHEH